MQCPLTKPPGLSPRVRGNQMSPGRTTTCDGSIPACAGEPEMGVDIILTRWVYPRVCGGTIWQAGDGNRIVGLSPRVRGNQISGRWRNDAAGSIPACAGEPAKWPPTTPPPQVYPRVCGGTANPEVQRGGALGLSPRVRGNRWAAAGLPGWAGSIPACAGEPRPGGRIAQSAKVYPRVCGGTTCTMPLSWTPAGLSPRVRGNPARRVFIPSSIGSIPACAGEPAGGRANDLM